MLQASCSNDIHVISSAELMQYQQVPLKPEFPLFSHLPLHPPMRSWTNCSRHVTVTLRSHISSDVWWQHTGDNCNRKTLFTPSQNNRVLKKPMQTDLPPKPWMVLPFVWQTENKSEKMNNAVQDLVAELLAKCKLFILALISAAFQHVLATVTVEVMLLVLENFLCVPSVYCLQHAVMPLAGDKTENILISTMVANLLSDKVKT